MTLYPLPLKTLCRALLDEGRGRLGMTMGIVSHIDGDSYEIVAVSSSTGVFVAGETFPLMNTYCRAVYEQKVTIALTELEGIHGLQRHPLYVSLPLEAYISAPIFHDRKVWGTINFSSMKVRERPFGKDEVQFVTDAAARLSKQLSDASTR